MRPKDGNDLPDFRRQARRRLPVADLSNIDSGLDDEVTLAENMCAFHRRGLLPSFLRNVPSPVAVSPEEERQEHKPAQVYRSCFHKDSSLNTAMMRHTKDLGVEVTMPTVDTVTSNRERDLDAALSTRPLVARSLPPVTNGRAFGYERQGQFDWRIFREIRDLPMTWDDVIRMVRDRNRQFCQKLAEILNAVGDRLDVMMDNGIQRGAHVLKALSLGDKAFGIDRGHPYPLAADGQVGVDRLPGLSSAEIERGMKLMGATRITQPGRHDIESHGGVVPLPPTHGTAA